MITLEMLLLTFKSVVIWIHRGDNVTEKQEQKLATLKQYSSDFFVLDVSLFTKRFRFLPSLVFHNCSSNLQRSLKEKVE